MGRKDGNPLGWLARGRIAGGRGFGSARRTASFGVKFFEINVLHAVFAACPDVKDAGDLLILRETLLEELGPAYIWLINLSLVDWNSLSEEDKELNIQIRLDWLASYTPCRTRAPLP